MKMDKKKLLKIISDVDAQLNQEIFSIQGITSLTSLLEQHQVNDNAVVVAYLTKEYSRRLVTNVLVKILCDPTYENTPPNIQNDVSQ